MGWPEMLDLPKIYSWSFFPDILSFHHEWKGHQICLQNGLDGKRWGHLLGFCPCQVPCRMTMLNASGEVRAQR